jgi:hypothetical protein
MTEIEVRDYTVAKMNQYPELGESIYGFYDLFVTEVEDGSSVEHEAELFYGDVDQLISEYETNTTTNR